MQPGQGTENPGSPSWFSTVEAPHIAASADLVAWDDAADFVVVGYGGAGVAAAIEAAEAGLSVIAIDRAQGGGATAMNGGVVYAGGGTRIQAEAGVQDTVDAMFAYLKREVAGVVSDTTLRRFCEQSPVMLDWMMRHGVKFGSRLYPGKTSYPTPDYYLYHSDSSLAASYKAIATPAARGHRADMPATGSAVGYGIGLYAPMRASASSLGVRALTKAEARQLVLDPDGRVIGVKVLQFPPGHPAEAEHEKLVAKGEKLLLSFPPAFPGASFFINRAHRLFARAQALEERHRVARYIQARFGVCLSAGGYVFNREMVQHYAPHYAQGMPLGCTGDDGSGIRLGQTAGGSLRRMDHLSAWRFINPPANWARAMLVNAQGERFIDETLYGAAIGHAICAEQGGRAWLILDAKLWAETWAELRESKILSFQRYPAMLAMLFGRHKAATAAGLAQALQMPEAKLLATLDAYNQAARGEGQDSQGKALEDLRELTQGPFYALDMGITSRLNPLPTLTLGGLEVDEESGHVLRASGAPIAGLYAAGRTAIGICSNLYVSGLSVSDCVFSGRRAAQAAAAEKVARG